MSETYTLTLSREQAEIVESACELLARLRIGQFNRITELLLDVQDVESYGMRRDFANGALKLAASAIFDRGLGKNFDTDKLHHRAWDVYQVLRYTRAWHDNPAGNPMSVSFDKPVSFIGEKLPVCEVKD